MEIPEKVPRVVCAVPLDIDTVVIFPHSTYHLLLTDATQEKVDELKKQPYLLVVPTSEGMFFDVATLGVVRFFKKREDGFTFVFKGLGRVMYTRVPGKNTELFYAQWDEYPTMPISQVIIQSDDFSQRLQNLKQSFKDFIEFVRGGLSDDTKNFLRQAWVRSAIREAEILGVENLSVVLDLILGVTCRVTIGNRTTRILSSAAYLVILRERNLDSRLEYTDRLLQHLTGKIKQKPKEGGKEFTQNDTDFLKSIGIVWEPDQGS